MSDVDERLANYGARPGPAPSDETVQRDMERGRAAYVRRRARRGAAAAASVLCVAAVGALTYVATTHSSHHKPAHQIAQHQQRAGTTHHHAARGIRLVAYTGDQKPGFRVTKVPEGYVLQGAQPSTLDIAPADNHTSLDIFAGKLVVMLQSADATGRPQGAPVQVNGRDGYLDNQDGVKILTYSEGTHEVQVQSWSNIDITDDQLIEFAEGVTVTPDAVAGHG